MELGTRMVAWNTFWLPAGKLSEPCPFGFMKAVT